MNFDLLTLKLAKSKVDVEGIANMRAELERRRVLKQELSTKEKTHVRRIIRSNLKFVDESSAFHNTLQRLLGYVKNKA